MAKSGDKCPNCGKGRFYICKSMRSTGGTYQVRTLKCNNDACGKIHNEYEVVLAESCRRRICD
jgi:hypothetical protein